MKLMQWSEQYELGVARMDDTHREFLAVYNALASAPAEDFVARLDDFIAHTETHFEQENRWMEKVDFPGCHRAEHDRVLVVLRDVRARAVAGDSFLGRRLVEELPGWFDNHAASMDAALAYHLQAVGFDTDSEQFREPGACADKGAAGCACATLSREPAQGGDSSQRPSP
ncbi:hemerythrin domain-containing protein [Pseudothauera lacus]|uniref:Cation-binding hemerythrin HHE n=1 Tax=Pseudothauera lacus TaxID=2136175 RepID=A0A2T4IDB0_9RHOO|nr:hemerythrin domain-containing protein [Pseudothauera lacus]PTD95726.1 cation-binding hemerythrin HHE [Pseudothauera lacus]